VTRESGFVYSNPVERIVVTATRARVAGHSLGGFIARGFTSD
jgi:hypothetical protein